MRSASRGNCCPRGGQQLSSGLLGLLQLRPGRKPFCGASPVRLRVIYLYSLSNVYMSVDRIYVPTYFMRENATLSHRDSSLRRL